MPVLRSREISSPTTPPPQQPPKTLNSAAVNLLEPPTPSKITEPLSPPSSLPLRRSLRRSPPSSVVSSPNRPRLRAASPVEVNVDASPTVKRQRNRGNDAVSPDGVKVDVSPAVKRQWNRLSDAVSPVGGKGDVSPMAKRQRSRLNDAVFCADMKVEDETENDISVDIRVSDFGVDVDSLIGKLTSKLGHAAIGRLLNLQSGFRIEQVSIGGESDDEIDKEFREGKHVLIEGEGETRSRSERKLRSPRRYNREEKGKGEVSVDDEVVVLDGKLEEEFNLNRSPRRFTREEKGKAVFIDDDVRTDRVDLSLTLGSANLRLSLDDEGDRQSNVEIANRHSDFLEFLNNEAVLNGEQVPNVGQDAVVEGVQIIHPQGVPTEFSLNEHRANMRIHQFKDVAKRNAARFAHFSAPDADDKCYEGGGRNRANVQGRGEVPQVQQVQIVEDWPRPFLTAMKIIKDMEKNLGSQAKKLSVGKGTMPIVLWTPKEKDVEKPKRVAPSLQSMCLKILAQNVDLIGSLNYVPDALRHTLCQMLCDSRKMNAHFFSLLLEGSPSEVRVADCSWLEEEEFEKSFQACDTSKLMVLQLDLCGHCVSDSSLIKALRHKGLPALATISLKGACRISDVGLRVLVSAAPSLRSMNLSQCSLLTDVGIESIADSLGSILHELYLDDCDTLDAMRILPTLKRLERLEVLSLRGIGGVSDKFINEFITSNGQKMKELVLANCTNLTDSSLNIIAETCSQLCVLDLSYLRKLTDISMAYLSNGCRKLQDLKLCRNSFSDDAIAAFLETSGETLKELSLNNITKVGQNTTLSLARRCKNLESLDLSWCRSLTDDALGLIADSCSSLRLLKIFGCTQITRRFIDDHSNPHLQLIGMKLTPILDHIKRPDFQHGPLHYSAVPSY